jgi:uncharacterized protein (DUF302 family)
MRIGFVALVLFFIAGLAHGEAGSDRTIKYALRCIRNSLVGMTASPATCLVKSMRALICIGARYPLVGKTRRYGGFEMKNFSICAFVGIMALPAAAQEAVTYPFDGSFDDATFSVENAIIGRGLVIDYVSHTGEMLNRTAADVGSDNMLFEGADIFLFCSAQLSREVMEVDPMNIAYCPYGIFVTERDGEVLVGHRTYPDGEMQKVETMLIEIIRDAVDG